MFSKTWTRNELEARAAADIAALPRYIRVDYLKGYDNSGDTLGFRFDPPGLLVRVDAALPEEQTRWMDDWLDPLWPVTPLETMPEMAGGHGWEMYGTSYQYPSGTAEPTRYDKVSRFAVFMVRLNRWIDKLKGKI
jgi:hypothetical protein